jgi:hypothetical protein
LMIGHLTVALIKKTPGNGLKTLSDSSIEKSFNLTRSVYRA